MEIEAEFGFSKEPFDIALLEYYSSACDFPRYRRLMEAGSAAGDALADYAVATWYLHGDKSVRVRKDIPKAIRLLRRASRTLNRAAYDLGVCYARGVGVKRSDARAYLLFERAAKSGCVQALLMQIKYLRDGIGVRRQRQKAIALERRVRGLLALYESDASDAT